MSLRNIKLTATSSAIILCVASLSTSIVAATGPTQTIPASDMNGLRSLNGGSPFVLASGDVNYTVEDRTVAHFPMSQVYPSFSSVRLNIPLDDIDPNDPTGDLDVYAFNGDGIVSANEFNAGTFYYRITGISGNLSTPSVDVTSLVVNSLATHANYLSFVFRQHEDGDRYALYPAAPGLLDIATLSVSVVPEPSAMAIACIGLAFASCRRRQTSHSRV
jgi:hypothetical protein